MADEPHVTSRAGRPLADYPALEQRVASLEAQLTTMLTSLTASVRALEAGQAQFNAWYRAEREEDLKEAEQERSEADFQRGQDAYKVAILAKREQRMRWLKPLLQGVAGILALVLAIILDSLKNPLADGIARHVGWGWWGLGMAAILVSLALLVLAIRAA